MLTALFLLWIAFNGRITLEVAAIGLVIATALYLFCLKFLSYRLKDELRVLKMLPAAFAYAALLLFEIGKASFAVMRIVLNHSAAVQPQMVTFHTPLQSTVLQSILANSITLTPGTLSVFCEGSKITVHCLDRSFAQGIENLVFQRQLLKLESRGK